MGACTSLRRRRELEAVDSTNTDLRSKLEAAKKELVHSHSIKSNAQNLVATFRAHLDESSVQYASFEKTIKEQSLELARHATKIEAQDRVNQTTVQERDHARGKSNDLQVEIDRLATKIHDPGTREQSLANKLLET